MSREIKLSSVRVPERSADFRSFNELLDGLQQKSTTDSGNASMIDAQRKPNKLDDLIDERMHANKQMQQQIIVSDMEINELKEELTAIQDEYTLLKQLTANRMKCMNHTIDWNWHLVHAEIFSDHFSCAGGDQRASERSSE